MTNTIGCASRVNSAYLYVCFKDLTTVQWYCYNRGWVSGPGNESFNNYGYAWGASPVYGEHRVMVGLWNYSALKTTYAN